MHVIKGKEVNAPTVLPLDPILIHRPTSENAYHNESAEYKQDGVDAEKDEKVKTWIEAVTGE